MLPDQACSGFLGGSFCPVWSYGLHYVGHYSAMCNERGKSRLV